MLFVNISNRDNHDYVIANLKEGHQGYGKVHLPKVLCYCMLLILYVVNV